MKNKESPEGGGGKKKEISMNISVKVLITNRLIWNSSK